MAVNTPAGEEGQQPAAQPGRREARSWTGLGRDQRLLLSLVLVSVAAVVGSWVMVRQAEHRLLEAETKTAAVHWATFIKENLSELDEILRHGLVSSENQRVFDFASSAGRIFRYEVIRADGVTALASWAGDFSRTHNEMALRDALRTGTSQVVLVKGAAFGAKPMIAGEAYVPVTTSEGEATGVLKVDIDMTERAAQLRRTANSGLAGLIGLLALIGGLCGWFVRSNLRERNEELREVVESRERVLAAERSMRDLHSQRQMILNTAGEGIFGLDLDGRITFINPAGARMLGRRPDALIGKVIYETGHLLGDDGGERQREECPIWAAVHGGETPWRPSQEEEFRRADGAAFPVEYTTTRLRDEYHAVTGAVVVFKDITERKRNERLQRERSRVLERLAAGASLNEVLELLATTVEGSLPGSRCSILLVDEQHRLRSAAAPNLPAFYNQAIDGVEIGPSVGSCGTAAYTGERVISDDITTDPRWEGYRKVAAEAGLRACWSVPVIPGGEGVVGTFALYFGEPRRPSETEMEIVETAAHLAGIAIKRKHEEVALQRTKEEAELANRSKTEFLANVSHELRTPLNAIIGFSEIIAKQMFGPVGDNRYEEYVKDIHDSGVHLLTIINEILDVSKAEAGKLEPYEELIEPAEVVDTAVRLLNERASNARIALLVDVPSDGPRLWADARMMKQVLINLVSNSVKFTPEGGQASIATDTAADGTFRFVVSDTGIGIDEEDIPLVLTPFSQVESGLSRKHAGTGLGLPLAKALVELHGGSLHIESAKDEGTTITIELPAERVVPRGAGDAPSRQIG